MKLKKDDKVLVLSGKDSGKKGKIMKVFIKKGTAIVEGINMVKKHARPTQTFQGGIVDRPNPIKVAKLMLICPRCNKPARVGKKQQDDSNLRFCRKCNEIIDKV
ncbi:50S ribosomal protein L24 [Candidatus Margulisiibacteriota bacterium]